MTNAEATARVKQELGNYSVERLIAIPLQVMAWWEKGLWENDRKAFSTVRGLIFAMNGWLGWKEERVHLGNIEGENPRTVIGQYCNILLAIVAERSGEGELLIDRHAWGSKREVCTIDGQPYTQYVKELGRSTIEEKASARATVH